MGKASSNKKIARAQRAGGAAKAGRQTSLLFPLSVTMVVVLGLALVVVARNSRDAEATGPPTLADHWHSAYEINICGDAQPPLLDQTDPRGIHTHADGVIHIHPFSEAAAGEDATLERFFEASGLEVADDRIEIPGGETFTEGEDQCDGEDAVVRVARWLDADQVADTDPQIFTEDFGDIRFLDDREAITFFFGPEDADIPPPSSIPGLDNLTDVIDPSQEIDPTTGEPLGPEGTETEADDTPAADTGDEGTTDEGTTDQGTTDTTAGE